jgi:hypothetical protein
VQSVQSMQAEMASRLPALNDVAQRLYRTWIGKLAR